VLPSPKSQAYDATAPSASLEPEPSKAQSVLSHFPVKDAVGAWLGIRHALYARPDPNYPDPAQGPRDFNEYLMPGPGGIAPYHGTVWERPAPDGPFGGKGPGEMCANPVLPAIANAVYNAVGVRVDRLPFTPSRVLAAIREKNATQPVRAPGQPMPPRGARPDRRRPADHPPQARTILRQDVRERRPRGDLRLSQGDPRQLPTEPRRHRGRPRAACPGKSPSGPGT